MTPLRRVVVTGVGPVSPVGTGRAAFADGLRTGRPGVARLRMFDPAGLDVQIGAEIPDFDPARYVAKGERKGLKNMARTVQLAVASARLALDDAGLAVGAVDPDRFGVVYGSGTLPGELLDLAEASVVSFDPAAGRASAEWFGRDGLRSVPPMWLLTHIPNMTSGYVSILNDARGPNNAIVQSDVSGVLAVGEAVRAIRRGAADVMLAGGTDSRTDLLSVARAPIYLPVSRRNDDPAAAARPFDRDRDGFVLAEGSGAVVLEELDHARRRGAAIRAEVGGFAAGFDRGRSGDGLARVCREALARAGVTPADLDHVNAHAAGTRDDDPWEARGLRAAVGDAPVMALKGQLGHTGAAGGVLELIGSLLAYAGEVVPATHNCPHPDPACPVVVLREPRPLRRPWVLKLAATDMGHCAAVAVRRWDAAGC